MKMKSWLIVAMVCLLSVSTAWAVSTKDRWNFQGEVTHSGTVIQTGKALVSTEDTTAANTLTQAECGKTIWLNSATEFATILPAISTVDAGCYFKFIVKTAPAGTPYTVTTGNSLENVLIGGVNELEVDTGDDNPYHAAGDTVTFTQATSVVGDYIELLSDGTSFYLNGQAQADGGVVPTQAD